MKNFETEVNKLDHMTPDLSRPVDPKGILSKIYTG
jgi:hypothetical protein